MIIFDDFSYNTHSLFPNSDWVGTAKYIIDDNSELANKIITATTPICDFVLENGVVVDVIFQPLPINPLDVVIENSLDLDYRLSLIELGL